MSMEGITNKHLKDGIQQFMGEAYEAACYALCLVDVAQEYRSEHREKYPEPELDVLAALYAGCENGDIYFNEENLSDNNNFFVQYPALFLERMTGKKWTVRHEGATYQPKENEYLIRRYERRATGRTLAHFERREFKPIKNSLTVIQGQLVSTRICKVTNE